MNYDFPSIAGTPTQQVATELKAPPHPAVRSGADLRRRRAAEFGGRFHARHPASPPGGSPNGPALAPAKAADGVADDSIEPPAPAPQAKRDARTATVVLLLAAAISFIHLCNYLNYSVVGDYLDFSLIRAAVGSLLALGLAVTGVNSIFSYHLKHNPGVYIFCALCFFSALLSESPAQTLKYSLWLFFSVFAALELARRVQTLRDLQLSLIIVIVPTFALSFALALVFGPQVAGEVGRGAFGGRVMGALGTHHIDAALALDYGVLFLAIASLGADKISLSRPARLTSYGFFAFSIWLAIYGLTRSVWLSFTIGLGTYFARKKKAGLVAIAALIVAAIVIAVVGVAVFDLLPEAIQNRIEVTQDRLESGRIDPRIAGILYGLSLPFTHPLGLGYAGGPGTHTHNSYFDIVAMVGVPGILVCAAVFFRSMLILRHAGTKIFMFFMIGAIPLLAQAFFEKQILPGQANFMVLLLWYAMSRSSYILFNNKTERRGVADGEGVGTGGAMPAAFEWPPPTAAEVQRADGERGPRGS